jgi:hypothetical protein
MAVGTCIRCHGNTFLEQESPAEMVWVCLQCGSYRYVRHQEPWPVETSLPAAVPAGGAR